MTQASDRAVAAFRGRLNRLPLGRHPALFFNPWIEGYRDFTFGGRTGPCVQVPALFHELGHAAQFGPEKFRYRASEGGFHFKVPRRFIFDRYCTEPKTSQATKRELETFAYQLHLMRLAGYKVDDQQFMAYSARLMQYMHDWWWVPGKGDEQRAAYCHQLIAECYARTTPAEVVDRLEAWLDATARRLKRKKLEYPATWQEAHVRERYHADGRVWLC